MKDNPTTHIVFTINHLNSNHFICKQCIFSQFTHDTAKKVIIDHHHHHFHTFLALLPIISPSRFPFKIFYTFSLFPYSMNQIEWTKRAYFYDDLFLLCFSSLFHFFSFNSFLQIKKKIYHCYSATLSKKGTKKFSTITLFSR